LRPLNIEGQAGVQFLSTAKNFFVRLIDFLIPDFATISPIKSQD
jgi:hypothetical protein